MSTEGSQSLGASELEATEEHLARITSLRFLLFQALFQGALYEEDFEIHRLLDFLFWGGQFMRREREREREREQLFYSLLSAISQKGSKISTCQKKEPSPRSCDLLQLPIEDKVQGLHENAGTPI